MIRVPAPYPHHFEIFVVLKLSQPQRRLQLRDAERMSGRGEPEPPAWRRAWSKILVRIQVFQLKTVIDKTAHLRSILRVVCSGYTAYASDDHVGNVSAETADIAQTAYRSAKMFDEHRLTAIFDNPDTQIIHNTIDDVHLGRLTEQMNGDDNAGFLRDSLLYKRGINAVIERIDIHEYRPHAAMKHDVRSGDKGGCRDDHLVTILPAMQLLHGLKGDLQGGGAAIR